MAFQGKTKKFTTGSDAFPPRSWPCLRVAETRGGIGDEPIKKLMGGHHRGFRVQAVNRMARADQDVQNHSDLAQLESQYSMWLARRSNLTGGRSHKKSDLETLRISALHSSTRRGAVCNKPRTPLTSELEPLLRESLAKAGSRVKYRPRWPAELAYGRQPLLSSQDQFALK
jgi:hypothetical protein